MFSSRMLITFWLVCSLSSVAIAQIPAEYGEIIPGTEDITLGPNIDLSNWNEPTRNLQTAVIQGVDLNGANFSNSWVDRARFTSNLSDSLFDSASLTDTYFENSDLSRARFVGADLTNARFQMSTFADTNLDGATIAGANFIGSDQLTKEQIYSTASYLASDVQRVSFSEMPMQGWDFAAVNLAGSAFARSDLSDATFANSDLSPIYFYRSDLSRVDFTGAMIANASFREVDGLTADQIYSTRTYEDKMLGSISLREVNLPNIDLSGQSMIDSDIRETNLRGANFRGADLSRTFFVDSPISNADFTDAKITAAGFFERSKITESQFYSTASYKSGDLSGIRLFDVSMAGWQMNGKDLTGSYIEGGSNVGTNYADSNLSNAVLKRLSMDDADLSRAILTNVRFERLNGLDSAKFDGAAINRARFINSDITFEQLSSTQSFRDRDLSGVQMDGNSLANWDFENQNLTRAVFVDSNLTGASFRGADLSNATIRLSSLGGSDFEDAILYETYLQGNGSTQMSRTQFESTASYSQNDLQGNWFVEFNMDGWNLRGQKLRGSSFNSTSLEGADLTSADLTDASFYGSTLRGAILDDAVVDGADFSERVRNPLGMSLDQIYSTRSYREGHLRNMRFSENRDLGGANFRGIDLAGTWFAYAVLDGADFTDAIIESTTFSDTFAVDQLVSTGSYKDHRLRDISFFNVDLSGVNLSGQDLTDSQFENVNLVGADLTDATIEGVQFYLIGENASDHFREVQLPSTRSFNDRNLRGVRFGGIDLSGTDLSAFDLTNASFHGDLTDINFADAEIVGAGFSASADGMLTAAQLYSTASYKRKDLERLDFDELRIVGWNFSGQDLGFSDFEESTFIDSDFTDAFLVDGDFEDTTIVRTRFDRADLRSASDVWRIEQQDPNTIRRDGGIHGLNLGDGETLIVRDFPQEITIANNWTMDSAAGLEIRFRSTEWGSTINVPVAIDPQLNGTLRLTLDQKANMQELVGLTFDVFDWEIEPTADNRFATIDTDAALILDIRSIYSTGEATLRGLLSNVVGDFDADREITANDIDLLSAAVRDSFLHASFDLNSDQVVDQVDRTTWLDDVANVWIGDANFDGEFNSSDLVAVFRANEYEDDTVGNSTWATGDWDGDGEFASSDLVAAFQNGGYDQGPRGMPRAVPEPQPMFVFALILCWLFRRRSSCHLSRAKRR